MRYLSLIVNDVIISQVETSLSDDQAIEIDRLLRALDMLQDNEELAITDDL